MSPDIPDSGDMEQRGVSSLLGTARSTSEPSSLSCPSAALLWPICYDLGGGSQIKISEIMLFILMEEEKHSWIFQVIHRLNKINGIYGFINNRNAIRWQPYHTSLLCLWQSFVFHLQTHWWAEPATFVPSKTTEAHPFSSEGSSKTSLLQQQENIFKYPVEIYSWPRCALFDLPPVL